MKGRSEEQRTERIEREIEGEKTKKKPTCIKDASETEALQRAVRGERD